MNFKVIDFTEAVTSRQKAEEEAAYDWAIKEQKFNGLVSQPIRMELDDETPLFEADGFTASLFVSDNDDDVILRRDWDDGFVVQYNIITNYKEAMKMAPKTIAKLIKNGIDLSKRYRKVFQY